MQEVNCAQSTDTHAHTRTHCDGSMLSEGVSQSVFDIIMVDAGAMKSYNQIEFRGAVFETRKEIMHSSFVS
jgi:hypothetical protein